MQYGSTYAINTGGVLRLVRLSSIWLCQMMHCLVNWPGCPELYDRKGSEAPVDGADLVAGTKRSQASSPTNGSPDRPAAAKRAAITPPSPRLLERSLSSPDERIDAPLQLYCATSSSPDLRTATPLRALPPGSVPSDDNDACSWCVSEVPISAFQPAAVNDCA